MTWNSYNKKYYMDLGYTFTKMYDTFTIDITHLNIHSHYLVDVECDICHKPLKKEYKSYNYCLNNNNFFACSDCRYHKTKITNNQKYGVDNVSHLDIIKKIITKKSLLNSKSRKIKRELTNLKKYGCVNPFQNEKIIKDNVEKTRKTKVKNGTIVSEDSLEGFELYKKIVYRLTYKNKKLLLKNWNGYDYYDDEYIKNNFILESRSPDYPTLDHKISIRYGYDNNISHEIISDINNLCMTKKRINTSKYTKTENEYFLSKL